jgi:anti-anti-sigma factor
MTVHHTPAPSAEGPIAGTDDPAVNVDTVRMRALMRHQATVVTISGDIDATNEHRVHDFATRYLKVNNAPILDLSGIEFCSAGGISVLIAVDDACRTADVQWTLVASRVVNRVLRLIDCDTTLPTASSVPEALEQVTELTQVRRRLALVMTTAPRHAV